MIIDTHIHENRYSSDSFIDFKDAVDTAKLRGLNGICITNHESNDLRNEIGDWALINGVLVIVGAEVLTHEGDILVFGLRDIPKEKVSAEYLLEKVKKANGVAMAAHPFRTNNRGLGNNIRKLAPLLSAVESFNGSTLAHHNLMTYSLAAEYNLASIGSSDAHVIEKIGTYSTKFYDVIRDEKDFIEAIKSGNFHPVMRKDGEFKNLDYNYHMNTREKTDSISSKYGESEVVYERTFGSI